VNQFLYTKYKQGVTLIGDIMVAFDPLACKAKQILEMTQFFDQGNVICRYYDYYLDSILIPGEFTHSGIIASDFEIIHSIAEGVGIVHPIDFVKDTDGFIILKPPYPSYEAMTRSLEKAYWHVRNQTEYDFTFKDPTKFYCHEFTVDCLRAGEIKHIIPTIKDFGVWPLKFRREVYLADDIIEKCKVEYLFKGDVKK
jgi:hypothetical protein